MNLIRTSLSLSLMGPALVWAQDVPFEAPPLQPSQMDFGGVGLMQMPTGRMAPEGEFNFAVTGSDEYLFYNVTKVHVQVRLNLNFIPPFRARHVTSDGA
ncbi:YjbH domain-containing protein, partial [Vibrio parahaemolyticus]|uniref:YjbH domain-containing protein n=1 Tax=Vibrio parahaemolyticus TaxID=670 RepID=UPI0032AEB126